MPDTPAPETLPTFLERLQTSEQALDFYQGRARPIDLRHVEPPPWDRHLTGPHDGEVRVWLRADGTLPDDPLLHVCVLTFASDLTLLDSVLARQGMANSVDEVSMASLDHAMWFERPFRADDWLLYSMQSPSASGGRGLASGRFFRRDGAQVCSVVQEGMVRVRS